MRHLLIVYLPSYKPVVTKLGFLTFGGSGSGSSLIDDPSLESKDPSCERPDTSVESVEPSLESMDPRFFSLALRLDVKLDKMAPALEETGGGGGSGCTEIGAGLGGADFSSWGASPSSPLASMVNAITILIV